MHQGISQQTISGISPRNKLSWENHLATNYQWYITSQQTISGISPRNKLSVVYHLATNYHGKITSVYHLATNYQWYITSQQTIMGKSPRNKLSVVYHLATNYQWYITSQQTISGISPRNKLSHSQQTISGISPRNKQTISGISPRNKLSHLSWENQTNYQWYITSQQTIITSQQTISGISPRNKLSWENHLATNYHGKITSQQTISGISPRNKLSVVNHHLSGISTNYQWYITSQQTISGISPRNKLSVVYHLTNYQWYITSQQTISGISPRNKLSVGNRTASVAEINAFYTSAVDMHDRLFDRTDLDVKDYDTFGYPLMGNRSSAVLPGKKSQKARLGNDITPMEEQNNYMALCRGERLVSVAEESRLVCRLQSAGHPYLLLRPLRVEERGLNPLVLVYHDLLTDAQAEVLKHLAEPKLARSMVQGGKGSEIVSISRTSQNAWLGPTDHPLMAKVYRLVEFVTGLSTNVAEEHAEIVQIANYGMGGHYTPHHDYLLVDKDPEELKYVHPKELDAGDRTATLMFYLSDVTRGGATVFPRVGASVWPKKGSAVFWYNLKKSGKEDPLTLHGACPVAVGSKWIANFWIREKGQTFRRPCALDSEL
ncbi:prolyl 4-hydroxylase subunit alpha-1 [Caerostris darwini]|uniref:Prolyl 4-hydroxylase subunit alpha-1 n=1 Tax=Caerostris darwini TaxID=1538125 RepID=A0AAV4VVA2_9ARAC|nr:prolyl 4-hydroxylase subunit alpha-1 [Caerostris darwini]